MSNSYIFWHVSFQPNKVELVMKKLMEQKVTNKYNEQVEQYLTM